MVVKFCANAETIEKVWLHTTSLFSREFKDREFAWLKEVSLEGSVWITGKGFSPAHSPQPITHTRTHTTHTHTLTQTQTHTRSSVQDRTTSLTSPCHSFKTFPELTPRKMLEVSTRRLCFLAVNEELHGTHGKIHHLREKTRRGSMKSKTRPATHTHVHGDGN